MWEYGRGRLFWCPGPAKGQPDLGAPKSRKILNNPPKTLKKILIKLIKVFSEKSEKFNQVFNQDFDPVWVNPSSVESLIKNLNNLIKICTSFWLPGNQIVGRLGWRDWVLPGQGTHGIPGGRLVAKHTVPAEAAGAPDSRMRQRQAPGTTVISKPKGRAPRSRLKGDF